MTRPNLLLLRHAATACNERGRYQGWADPPLSPTGMLRARELRHHLRRCRPPVTVLWSSDLRRAWRTAALACPEATVRRDRRLRELDLGDLEGLTYTRALDRYGSAFTAWLAEPGRVPPPGGAETVTSLGSRVRAWLEEITTEPPTHDRASPEARPEIVAISHAGPIYALLAILLSLEFTEARRCFPLKPCEGVRIRCSCEGTTVVPFPQREGLAWTKRG